MISPTSRTARITAIVGASALLMLSTAARGQSLSVRDDSFTIDGVRRFLVFVSYFDGSSRPSSVLSTDLQWLKSQGIDGVRVWPNASSPRLMTADGRLNTDALSNLKSLIDRAAALGMMVDVTFHREGVCSPPSTCGFTVAAYERALVAAATELRERRNVLFDLQNEWNAHGNGITLTDLRRIRSAVNAAAPSLVITASTSGDDVADAARNAFDVVSYHGPRDANGSWAEDTDELVASLRDQFGVTPRRITPVYMQEPNRFRIPEDTFTTFDQVPDHYWRSVQNAKRAGAAAWTFHTGACFNLSSGTAFSALLQEGERAVLSGLADALSAQPEWGVEKPRRPDRFEIRR